MEDSRIEYVDHTFSPWIGCGHGCSYCYAARFAARFPQYQGCFTQDGPRVRTSPKTWNKLRKWNAQAAKVGSRFVILPSLCDPFELRDDVLHDDLAEPRRDFFKAIAETQNLQYLLLTKRPRNIKHVLVNDPRIHLTENIWLGASVENQAAADARIPELLDVDTPRRFLSLEPLLGPVNLKPYLHGIHWVIVGGMSGPEGSLYPLHPDWVRSIRDQCATEKIPFFFKQWGEFLPSDQAEIRQFNVPTFTEDICLHHVGTKHSGNILDGKLHLDIPSNLYN